MDIKTNVDEHSAIVVEKDDLQKISLIYNDRTIDELRKVIYAMLLETAMNYDKEKYEHGEFIAENTLERIETVYVMTDDDNIKEQMYYLANAMSFTLEFFQLGELGIGTDYWMIREECIQKAMELE